MYKEVNKSWASVKKKNNSPTGFKRRMVKNKTSQGGIDRREPGRTGAITTRGVSVILQSQGMTKYKEAETQGLPMTRSTIGGGRSDTVNILPHLGISP